MLVVHKLNSSQTVALIQALERLPVQKDTPFKNDNLCIPCLTLKIVKENHTLFSGTNPLIGPNKVRQCPASGICV